MDTLNLKRIILWIEDNQPLVSARKPLLEDLLTEYNCTLEVRSTLLAGKEFLENSAESVAVVILDLDIPESSDSVGHDAMEFKPTGLLLLEAYGWLPFIVFSGHSELEGLFPQPLPTPLAWLEKGANPEELGTYVRYILRLQAGTESIHKLSRETDNRELRSLVCLRFHLQSFKIPLSESYTHAPWETLSLAHADDLAQECIENWEGRYIGWAGCNLFFEFPGEAANPDHLRSALSAVAELWQRSHGPRAERLRWNQWFIPPFSASFLPNHVNLAERIRPSRPGLHGLGRPGEIVSQIAKELRPGFMGLVEALLIPGSRSAEAFDRVGTAIDHLSIVLPYSSASTVIAVKAIPNNAFYNE